MNLPTNRVDLLVLGAGGHGAEVGAYAAADGSVNLLGFIDESKARGCDGLVEVLGDLGELARRCEAAKPGLVHYITAFGSNEARQRVVAKVKALGLANLVPWTLVDGGAHRGPAVELGDGTCVAPGAIVTTRIRIGAHCIVNVNASVSHDCVVGNFCNINPGAVLCGNVTLGEGCYVGAGAIIKERVTIGAWTIVGAGAVVIGDLPAAVTAVGAPARAIKTREVQGSRDGKS
jgi:sugar O-acyltransferase (sialic acid O-acetyltransferase NeuD family)